MKKPTFNFSSNPAIKGLTKTEKQADDKMLLYISI